MNKSSQINETLISLIELNQDKTWIDAFYGLRFGKNLPGGGAGSLNDWGPIYDGIKEQAWYGNLYELLRLINSGKTVSDSIEKLKHKDSIFKIYLKKCENCHSYHLHPSILEKRLSTYFLAQNVSKLIEQNKLIEILNPEYSFKSEPELEKKKILTEKLIEKQIQEFNFRNSPLICPHCEKDDVNTNMDYYLTVDFESLQIEIVKE